jgi:diacylglycerol O-acyltransferase / wax synthase
MDRMNPLDASFLYVEDGITHLHIASCAIFEGAAPAYADLLAAFAAKLPLVPRYRQVVRFVPLQLGRPVWVDDPHFRLEYHLRHTALPAPGGDAELRRLMGRLMSQQLDRHRPMWEAWLVEGLAEGRWALISKIHHCMADGVSGTDLLATVLDRSPKPAAAAAVEPWHPAAPPSALRLVADAMAHLATSPVEQIGALRSMLRAPRQAVSQLVGMVGGMVSYAPRILPTPANSLVGSIGPHRRWTWAAADLAELNAIRHAFGGTINDVVIAVITSGLRDMLRDRGEPVDRLVVRSLAPVSVRSVGERGTVNNRVSAMFADLPVAIEDPVERLEAVSAQMRRLKASHQAEAGEGIVALGGATPPPVIALAERTAMLVLRRVAQHSVNTVTTNVPGPQYPLYLAGRQMVAYLPFVPIAHGMRVGVAIVSYNGRVWFGVTGDYDTAPDIGVLASGIEDAVATLSKLIPQASGSDAAAKVTGARA